MMVAAVCLWAGAALAQSCSMGSDMDQATRTAIQAAATRYFGMVVRNDTALLQQNAIPSLAAGFSGIAGAVKDNQSNLAGANGVPRAPFLLKEEGTTPDNAEFLCGVFGANGQTANSAVFEIPSLPPGTYALDTLDATTPKGSFTPTFVLQQMGTDWKIAGLYLTSATINGHDSDWFANQARQYKAAGKTHDAYLYFLQSRILAVPVPFMSTLKTDKLYEEAEAAKPADLPTPDHMIDLPAGAKTYKLIEYFALPVQNDLDLVVRYGVADVSNTTQAFQDNIAVIKAIVAKYPEFREAFAGVVARAVAPSGQDYGTLLPMNEIK